jgi:hypothetical protein
MKDLIGQTATKILYDQTPEEIHAFLIGEGMSEGEAFLTYQAGKIIAKDRSESPIVQLTTSSGTTVRVRR